MKKTICSAAFIAGSVFVGATEAGAQEAPPAPAPVPVPPHTVAPGDTLWSISASRLGASERWAEIYALNRGVLRSPDMIEAGQVLQIPSAPVPVPPDLLAPAPASPRRSAPAVHRTASTRSNTGSASVRSSRAAGGSNLASIRRCESGGNYQAVSSSGKYRGAYQFDQRTWQSVGGTGDPAAASPAEQDARARQLQAQRGSSPWANCS